MPEGKSAILKAMRDETARTVSFFHQIPTARWSDNLYMGETGWSIRELLVHFIDAEQNFVLLLKDVLAGGPGAPENFDLETHNRVEVARLALELADFAPDDLIARFAELRIEMLRTVEAMAEADFERQGRHPTLGLQRMADFLRVVYLHNRAHQRDIHRMLQT